MKVTEMKQKLKQNISYKDFSEVMSKKTYCKIVYNTIILNLFVLWDCIKVLFTCLFNLAIFPLSHRWAYKDFKQTKDWDDIYEKLSKNQ